MIGVRDASGKPSIAGTLQVGLLGLTIVLAIIGAVGIAALYDARQKYEDEVAEASALEVSAANLLASTVALEANLARPRSRRAARFVAAAGRSFDDVAGRVVTLAVQDDRSLALAAPIPPARRDAAALAEHPTIDATRGRAARNLRAVRTAVQRVAARQGERRDEARDRAASRSRSALLAIGFGAGLALVGVLAFLTLLIRAMRRPLDDLVGATRRMSSGDLTARVDAGGPKELEAVGLAFNAMGADLASASERVEAQRQRLSTTIQSLGDGLVICDTAGRVTSLNPRASELVPRFASARSRSGSTARCHRSRMRSRARSWSAARATSRSRSRPRASPGPTGARSGRCVTSPSARAWSRPRATSWPPRHTSCAAR